MSILRSLLPLGLAILAVGLYFGISSASLLTEGAIRVTALAVLAVAFRLNADRRARRT